MRGYCGYIQYNHADTLAMPEWHITKMGQEPPNLPLIPQQSWFLATLREAGGVSQNLVHSMDGSHAHASPNRDKRIGKTNGIFASPSPLPACTSSRYPRAAPAAPPARGGRLPQQRAARRGAAERSLERQLRMG